MLQVFSLAIAVLMTSLARGSSMRMSVTAALEAEGEQILETHILALNETVRSMLSSAATAPTAARPFVFFHQRKTGGSSARRLLHAAAETAGVSKAQRYVACYDGLTCETYSPPEASSGAGYALLGGHLYHPAVEKYLFWSSNGVHASLAPAPPTYDCLTIHRATADRVASCWNYRFVQVRVLACAFFKSTLELCIDDLI